MLPIFKPIAYIRDLNRLREIVTVLAKHGFGQLVVELGKGEAIGKIVSSFRVAGTPVDATETSMPQRVRLVFQDLGPTFIKLGQILSTRHDIIPEEFIFELKKLQDSVPAFSFPEAKEQIESELGRPLAELFPTFNPEPIGRASIGQVYIASLPDGREVVVKVQRPDVRKTLQRDIELLEVLAKTLEKRVAYFKSLDLQGVLGEFHHAVSREVDYNNERRNIFRFQEIFREDAEVVIPEVYRDYCSTKVLTMERIHGVKINQALSIGDDPDILAKVAVRAVFRMVFECGFFHADPHPGNIFAMTGNRIAFLDMGMVGRLDEGLRYRIADVILSVMERDVEEVSRILLTLSVRRGRVDQQRFRRDVAEIMDKVTGVPIEEICFNEILRDILECARNNNLKVPVEYTLMGKALLTVEGVAKEMVPGLDIEREVAPYIRELLTARFSPKRLSKSMFKRVLELYHWTNVLPGQLVGLMEDASAGNLKIRVEQTEQMHMMKNLERIMGKLTSGLIISSLILSSAVFITFSQMDHRVFGIPINFVLGGIGYLAAAIIGLLLVREVVRPIDPE